MTDDTAAANKLSRIGHDLPVAPMVVYLFDGKGGVSEIDLQQAASIQPVKGFVAVAGNLTTPEFRIWLKEKLGEGVAERATAPNSHSRCTVAEDRATLVMRVVRRDADPDDVQRIPITMWLERGRAIVAARADLSDLMPVQQWQVSRRAPVSPADLVARLGLRAADRLEPLVEQVGDVLDDLEEEIMGDEVQEATARLTRARRTLITLRRLIWPQRDVLNTLEIEELSFFTERDKARLHEASSRTARLGEEIQALSERAALVHEQILDSRGEQMNRTMLVLASVTVVAMPMTVISGLLGMNIPGIPFEHNPEAFWIVVLLLVVIGFGMVWFMHKRHWL